MQLLRNLNKASFFFAAAFAIAAGLFCFNSLFFYDEDVFVINTHGIFMQQAWQRSVLPKFIFKVESFFFGANPQGYHIVSILLHLCCAFAATAMIKIFMQVVKIAVSAAQMKLIELLFFILFLFSPIHSEPLCYILAQGVMLAALFCLLSLLYYLKAQQKNKKYSIASLLFFAAALLSYEISWLLPVIVLCIAFFNNTVSKQPIKKILLFPVSYFIVLALWLAVKTIFISKTLVADYSGFSILNINPVTILRNTAVLLLRNFVPPFKNTSSFAGVSVAFVFVITAVLFNVYKKDKNIFKTLLLLLLLCVLAFFSAAPFGIDTHDSESERYVYFSSVFALFFMTLLLVNFIKSTTILQITAFAIIIVYSFCLCTTLGYYQKAGKFSKKYTAALNTPAKGAEHFYLVNQPAQYQGALLFRAQSRLPNSGANNSTVLNEYMQNLFGNHQTKFVTLSVNPIKKMPVTMYVTTLSIDSVSNYFPFLTIEKKMGNLKADTAVHLFNINKDGVAALRNDTLYIFK